MTAFHHAFEARQRLIDENELPHLPGNWDVQRFRFLFRESKERNGSEPVGEMLSVSEHRGVIPREYEHDEQRRTDEELQTYRVVHPGQLAVNTMWLNHLGLGVSEHLGHVSPAYAVYDISPRLDRRFVHHLLRSQYYLKIYLRYLYGIRPNSFQIKTDDWNSVPVIVPPLDVQKAIADFLDRETTRISQLISKKQKLVRALSENISTAIDHAVTLGLDRSTKTRLTGIPWIPEIPAAWQLEKAKYLYRESQRPPLPEDRIITAFRDGQVTLRENRRTEGFTLAVKEVGYQHIRAGDLVIHTMDAFAGAIGVSDSDGKSTGEYAVCEARSDRVNNYYYAYLLRCMAKRNYIYILCPSVRERAPRFRFVRFAPVLLPVPPRAEQDEIVRSIQGKESKVEEVVHKTQQSITHLHEYRSALITAAVTGQIDVANWRKCGEADRRLDRIQEEMTSPEVRA